MKQPQPTADPPTERELLTLVSETLRSVLPTGWNSDLQDAPWPADAAVVLTAPDGRSAHLLVESKSILDARDVPVVQAQLRSDDRPADGSIVVARYVSPRAREALTDAGMSYVDATGNVRVAVDDPALFVLLRGVDRDPWRSPDRPTNSLRGKPAARVVRALADRSPPWKVRELAIAAESSLGSTSRTVDFLVREALITRDKSGAIVDVLWPELLERWAADYELTKRRRTVGLLAPQGVESTKAALQASPSRYALSGSIAAAQWAPYAEPRLAVIYASDLDAVQSALGLRPAPSRSNVLLIEPEDDYVFTRTVERDGMQYAAPSQVAVGLLVGPGRNPEEGQALIRWMKANEPAWRSS
jgi:hypothetical protein